MSNDRHGQDEKQWRLQREKILLRSGLAVIAATFIFSVVSIGPVHLDAAGRLQFLGAGLALCGIGIAQGLDRRGR